MVTTNYWPSLNAIFVSLLGLFTSLSGHAQSNDPAISIEAISSENGELTLTLSLDPGNLHQQSADWFLVYTLGEDVAYYSLSTGQFETGLSVTHQGALESISPASLEPITLAVGDYTFYFAIDLSVNGEVDMDSLVFDSASLSVTEPLSCSNLGPGDFFDCVRNGRPYSVHVPDTYDGSSPFGLIIDLHGTSLDGDFQRLLSGYTIYGRDNGLIVAYPEARPPYNRWYSHRLDLEFASEGDISYIRGIVEDIRSAALIDDTQIIVAGYSNGGSMAHTMACTSADIFTAAIPVAFGLSGGNTFDEIKAICDPVRPISIVQFYALDDSVVPYNGGPWPDVLGARDSNDLWAEIQNCDVGLVNTQVNSQISCETHVNCDGGVSVTMCSVSDVTHGGIWFGVAPAKISDTAFELLQQFE